MGLERKWDSDRRPNPLDVHINQFKNLAYFDVLQFMVSLVGNSFCNLWLPPKQLDHAQNIHRYSKAPSVSAASAPRRHLTFCSSLDTRICLSRSQPLTHKPSNPAHLFHGFFLNLLDSLCNDASDREEGEHCSKSDKYTPAKDAV